MEKKAEMGLGYGSEYQLLRFLGHHRQELEQYILKQTNLNENLLYQMEWLDFPKDETRKSLDGEHKGIDFLPVSLKNKIINNWKIFWPKKGQNWDAILYLTPIVPKPELEDKWVIVEAKAHLKELESSCKAENEESIKKIETALEATKKHFNINTDKSWMKQYYQLANRLAFVSFMLENGINCSLLNIYFINGWTKDSKKNVLKVNDWKKAIQTEYSYLGINSDAKKYISEVFIEC